MAKEIKQSGHTFQEHWKLYQFFSPSDIDALLSHLSDTEIDLGFTYESENVELRADILTLKGELREAEQNLLIEEENVRRLENRVEELLSEVGDLRVENRELDSNNSALEREISYLEGELRSSGD